MDLFLHLWRDRFRQAAIPDLPGVSNLLLGRLFGYSHSPSKACPRPPDRLLGSVAQPIILFDDEGDSLKAVEIASPATATTLVPFEDIIEDLQSFDELIEN